MFVTWFFLLQSVYLVALRSSAAGRSHDGWCNVTECVKDADTCTGYHIPTAEDGGSVERFTESLMGLIIGMVILACGLGIGWVIDAVVKRSLPSSSRDR